MGREFDSYMKSEVGMYNQWFCVTKEVFVGINS